MFSITTMASSTKIPTTSESPSKDIRFSVYPMKYNPMKVAINERGIATIVITAFLKLCKKNSIMNPTKAIARNKSKITLFAAFSV